VLEPVANVEITAPEQAMGDIAGDLSSRRGQVNGTANSAAGSVTIRGQAPLAELAGYQSRLNAMTAGQGRYALALSHYDPVPPTVQAQLTSQHKVRDEE
jgi:elongation factor G